MTSGGALLRRPELAQLTRNGQRMILLEDLPPGSAKEVAEKVRQGKATLRIVGTPWGVEFYICETGDLADRVKSQVEIFLPSTQYLRATAREEIGIVDTRTSLAPALGSLEPRRCGLSLAALTIMCMISNFIAYVISAGLPQKYVELNLLDRPVSSLSLARSEGLILAASILLLALIRDVDQRTVLHSLVLGVLAADAVNDAALVYAGNWLLALGLAVVILVSIPAIVHTLLPPRGGNGNKELFCSSLTLAPREKGT